MFKNFVLFGIIDNGVILLLGLLGISLEKYIEKKINYFIRNLSFTLKIKSSAKFALLVAMIANAISDFCGGIGVGLSCMFGTFFGCLIIAIILIPMTFKKINK